MQNEADPSDPSLIRDELLQELFESSVDQGPERTAVLCGPARLTYRELDERANRVAHSLRARGVGREDRVAILLPRSEHVYAAILAVLKAGAAYVPLDMETPVDRLAFILKDCAASCLVTLSGLADSLAAALPAGVRLLRLDLDAPEIARMPSSRIPRAETGTGRADCCYVIYTSGTTGQPKGVQIEHRNATNLIRAEQRLYGIRPEDRVFQFFSIAFDASVEEIWMAFFNGAALVAGTQETIRPEPEFSRLLELSQVTVLSCVPTFLSLLEADIPTVRILILGGEACPADLSKRWCRPGRTVFNTYGPTEATVVATAAVLEAGRPVTIGRPIANYRIFLLDERLEPVAPGAEGEICIGGEGVARGYLNRPRLQQEKFIVTDKPTGRALRLYRTGDLARLTPEGELDYLGRADDQVKLRGYRIELSEIESVLMQCPGVLAAAAAVHRQTQRIAAYIVPRAERGPDRALLRETLAARLPPYMMPAFLDEIATLPVTVSGKIDRKRLPPPSAPLEGGSRPGVAPRSAAECEVAGVWRSVLGREDVSADADFFADLGGHSLLAAVAVSKLRRHPGFERVSIADLYSHPTVARLAGLASGPHADAGTAQPFHRASTKVYLACAAGQAVGVLFLAGLCSWQWLGEFLAYGYLVVADWPVRKALLGALAVYLVTAPALLLLSIAVKWLLLGRIRPGRHPLWGWYYLRFWFVRAVTHLAPVHYLAGTPLINFYYRLMGAKIGRDVFISSIGGRRSSGLTTFDTVTVGDGTSIGTDSSFDGSSVEGGMLRIAPVTIGRDCWIGNRSSIGSDAVLEDGAGLADLSMLPEGARIPAGELWRGSPAAPAGRLEPETPRRPWTAASALAALAGVFVFPLVFLAAIMPGLMLITHLGHMDEGYSFLVVCPLVALSFIVFVCLEAWAFKWLLIGRLREGRYPVGGSFYFRKWFCDRTMDLSLEVIGTLYTTLYLRPWLKALGARIGPRSEIDAIRFEPDLLETGAECFLAEDVLIGAPRVRSGWVSIGRVRLGERVFAGACTVFPAGTRIGNDVLVGTFSIPPRHFAGPVPNGSTWFGSPPIEVPTRHTFDAFSERQTFRPPRRLVALRLFIEFFRVILPATLFVMLASLMMNATDILQDYMGLGRWLLIVPLLYVAAGVLAVSATILLKWLLIGRYRAGEKPLWCGFIWLTELVTGVYSNLCVAFFLELLRGTPFIVWPLRGLGMKIGRRCYLDSTWFSEFDLNEIGDEVALNGNACPLTHLFEGRVMKLGRIRIGDRCTLGAESAMQYDTEIEAGSSLGDLSLLMKGDVLPGGTHWHGIPAACKN
jgi:non-ribosomal peptide synthetase-like protein